MGTGVENCNGDVVGFRLSWIAGIAGIALALARMQRLLRPSLDGLPWEIILAAAAILGGAITWALMASRVRFRLVVLTNLVAMVLTAFRIAVPTTTWLIFPTAESLGAMRVELEFARDVIRSGVAPVLPLSGVVAIVAMLFWLLGAVLAWGLARRRPYVAVLPPLVVYLQFATMDRVPSGYWSWLFLPVLGLSLAAVAFDKRREGTGSLTTQGTRMPLVRSVPSFAAASLVLVFLVAVVSTNALVGLVPGSGLLEWRVNSGLSGDYYGSISYNPFVGIHQDLVSQTNVPIFVAELDGDVGAEEVYWRLLSLDSFSGGQWYLDEDTRIREGSEVGAYEHPDLAFKGPTTELTQTVTILALQQDWLPAAYAPQRMSATNRTVDRGFRVRTDDASLRFDALSYRGMNYDVVSAVPLPDIQALARTTEGTLSPIFERAAADGLFDPSPPSTPPGERFWLDDADRYLDLPADDEELGRIATLALAETDGLATDYERALALETFFRSLGTFRYSTEVTPGHGASDLASWLLDPDSPNYRVGYCEQFATSMAVMARQVGIPSRVILGFTPGAQIDDGRVVVRDRNAHAWVELWMPAQGWVRFDPTPRGDGVNPASAGDVPFNVETYLRPEIPDASATTEFGELDAVPLPDFPNRPIPDGATQDQGTTSGPIVPGWALPTLGGLVIAFGLLPGIKALRRRRRMRRLRQGDISAAWSEIVDRLTDLGAGPNRAATPVEFAETTDPYLIELADAYGSIVYGPEPEAEERAALVAVAERSMEETEEVLPEHFTRWQRFRARYSLRSIFGRR